jgi:hypothetical protein
VGLVARRIPVPRPPPNKEPRKPPVPPRVQLEDEIKTLKWKLWMVWDVVDKGDWRKFDDPKYVALLNDIERELADLNRRGLLRPMKIPPDKLAGILKMFVAREDRTGVYLTLVDILLGLPPHLWAPDQSLLWRR